MRFTPDDDAVALHTAALEQNRYDAPRACHWLLHRYRSDPTPEERRLIDDAVWSLVRAMSDDEYTRWRKWNALPPNERPEKP